MVRKNTIVAILVVAFLGTAFGNVNTIPIAATTTTTNQADASLLVNQVSGSNKAELTLQIDDSYYNSITSIEMHMQFDKNRISKVSMDWKETYEQSSCRAIYNQNTGLLRVYVVGTSDLIENGMISIGTLQYDSSEKDTFSTSLSLEKLNTVDLRHDTDTLSVASGEQEIEFIYNNLSDNITTTPPSSKPSSTPSTPPSGNDSEEDKTEVDSNGENSNGEQNTPQSSAPSTPSENSGNQGSNSNETSSSTNKDEISSNENIETEFSEEIGNDSQEDSVTTEHGSSNMFTIIGGISVCILALAGIGIFIWKKKKVYRKR